MTNGGPDFVVPGAKRSGTTSLYRHLRGHEDLFLPAGKDLHFFQRESNYSKGLSYYESEFDEAGDRVAGDVSPAYFEHGMNYESEAHQSYTWSPDDDAATRLARAYPDVKLILTLRNPVTRAHSQFWKNYRQGRERAESFAQAIREELAGDRQKESTPRCWVYTNRYPVHVGHWLDLFDRDQVKFLVFERWTEAPERALDDVCEFLGVPPRESWPNTDEANMAGGSPRLVTPNRLYQRYVSETVLARPLRKFRVTHALDSLNSSPGYPDLTEEARALLAEEFRPDIDQLEAMTGLDLDVWREELYR